MPKFALVRRVIEERFRQEELKKAGKIPHTLDDLHCTDVERLSVLIEEVGEVGTALQDKNNENLAEELSQVAAVCLAWLEYLEKYELHTLPIT